MKNKFDFNSVTILQEYDNNIFKVIGKYVGGKRNKRATIQITDKAELRAIRLNQLLKNNVTQE
jgi:hypothetical protein